MGTPEYADRILKRLLQEEWIKVIGVFTQPDKPVGRKKVITPPPTKLTALKYNIPLFQPHKLREMADEVENLKPDFIVVGAYGQILSKEILKVAPAINLHTSILPKYRGASPIQQALLNGDKVTGVTAMLMNEGLDTGDILGISQIQIKDEWRLEELYNQLTDMAGELIINILNKFNQLKPIQQRGVDASFSSKIAKRDGLVDFKDVDILINKFRAFTPWPSIYLESGLKLIDIEFYKRGLFKKGEILTIEKDRITIGCGNGSIVIKRVQPQSKSQMDITSYINGKRLKIGDIFY